MEDFPESEPRDLTAPSVVGLGKPPHPEYEAEASGPAAAESIQRQFEQRNPWLKITANWASLINSRVVKPAADDLYIGVNRHFLVSCLRPYLMVIRVDEEWYLQQHPDVAIAIQDGLFRSAREHYVRFGFFENRMPYPIQVDEAWYTTSFSDVRLAIEAGVFRSAQHHFDSVGYGEGRRPSPDFVLAQADDR